MTGETVQLGSQEYFDAETQAALAHIVNELMRAENRGVEPDYIQINEGLKGIDNSRGAIDAAWQIALGNAKKEAA